MFHAVVNHGALEQLVNSFNAAADGICRKIMKISFFQNRIDSSHTYTNSNIIDIMFDAVITWGVLEQLVNSFNAAADGICS